MHSYFVVLTNTLKTVVVLFPVLSLGVIFFEMCVRFATGMERAMVLTGTTNDMVKGGGDWLVLIAHDALFYYHPVM